MEKNFPVVRPSHGIRSIALAMRTAAAQGTASAAVFSQVADKGLDILADRVAEAEEMQARTHARLQAIEAAAKEVVRRRDVGPLLKHIDKLAAALTTEG
jgi:hypothetical protein